MGQAAQFIMRLL